MADSMRMWMEIIFNVVYLIVVWGIVITMVIKRDSVQAADQRSANLVIWAFALLALGDTGHVGFRVVAYAMGDLNTAIILFGREIGLVGLGALATAITVTFFYAIVLMIWQERFQKPYGWFGYFLFATALLRLVVMIFPGNEWNNLVPPQPWGLIRNIPLIIQGLGVAYLILRDAQAARDRAFMWIGISILTSYALYIPVIIFVQKVPLIGMLMIPKTMAYVAIAFIAYYEMYLKSSKSTAATDTGSC